MAENSKSMEASAELKACPACGKKRGEVVERGGRFPFFAVCRECGWSTAAVKLRVIAVKLWNEAKKGG